MTAAAAATVPPAPGLHTGPVPGESADGFARWERQVASTGYCTKPVRLHGRIDAIDLATGERRTMYSTDTEPDRTLLIACGNRRESVCPPCSEVYKRDARQVVRAGLAGGKGIPESVSEHPCVFATLTAPSFGPVHARRKRGATILPCRPRRDANARRCPHGRDISCAVRHHENDPRLGRPLCPGCYDYTAAVLFNACTGELWRRFTISLPRRLAALAGITQKQLRNLVRVRYVKVAEYQARGAIHYHAVIRLDAPGDGYQPPPAMFTADLLSEAIRQAAATVRLALGPDDDHPAMPTLALGFGDQTDPKPIRHHNTTGRQLTVAAVANYIAKYATKTLTAPGLPDHRLRDVRDIENLTCPAHYQQMIRTAWQLGQDGICGEPLRRWAHMLGFGGHFLTKSRRYSVTFGQLRRARVEHRKTQHHPDGERDPWGRPLDDTVVLVLGSWTITGIGYRTMAEADLAMADAARARDHNEWPASAA